MRVRFALVALVVVLAGCGRTTAPAPDPANPFRCGVAFSVYYGIAKSTGGSAVGMLERRMLAEAAKARALPASKRTREEGEALSKRLAADPDEAYRTVVECSKRQDAEAN